MQTLTITTSEKDQVMDLTESIEKRLHDSSLKKGLVHIFALHTTCGITVSDLDPGSDQDLLDAIRTIIPKLSYLHPHDPEHMPDHIASSIIGVEVTIPFKQKKLILGKWQRIVLLEFDGPREREIAISFISTD